VVRELPERVGAGAAVESEWRLVNSLSRDKMLNYRAVRREVMNGSCRTTWGGCSRNGGKDVICGLTCLRLLMYGMHRVPAPFCDGD